MNVPWLVAGSLSLLAAAIHGIGGEILVVRKLSLGGLPSSPFGGPVMTRTMIRVSWHIATIGFLTVGLALVLSASVLHGETAREIGLLAAIASSGFAALPLGTQLLRLLQSGRLHEPGARLHFGPIALTAVAVLAWLGLAATP